MSFTPFNAPLLVELLGDREVAAHFSVQADIDQMIAFEVALAEAQAREGVIPESAAQAIGEAAQAFNADIRALTEATARDGVSVPEFVRQFRATLSDDVAPYFHFGTTSQDLVDSSAVIRLRAANAIIIERVALVAAQLRTLDQDFGSRALMGRTRMQRALPITVRDRVAQWLQPLAHWLETFETVEHALYRLQLAGPAGRLDAFPDAADAVRAHMAAALDLLDPKGSWHTDRAALVAYGQSLSMLAGHLAKIGKDCVLMAQNEVREIVLTGGGRSSAMGHKHNPVAGETLVTLSQFCTTLAGGLGHALVHEQERSGIAWALEWLLLPQLVVATGASTRTACRLLTSVDALGSTAD